MRCGPSPASWSQPIGLLCSPLAQDHSLCVIVVVATEALRGVGAGTGADRCLQIRNEQSNLQ